MPIGQMTEQYNLPKSNVRTTSAAITAKFIARTAGRNCTLAIQPSQACNVPVKSRNSIVTPTKNMVARMIRIFLNIIFKVCHLVLVQSASHKFQAAYMRHRLNPTNISKNP